MHNIGRECSEDLMPYDMKTNITKAHDTKEESLKNLTKFMITKQKPARQTLTL